MFEGEEGSAQEEAGETPQEEAGEGTERKFGNMLNNKVAGKKKKKHEPIKSLAELKNLAKTRFPKMGY